MFISITGSAGYTRKRWKICGEPTSFATQQSSYRSFDAERLVAALYELATVRWEPTGSDWWEAGRLVRNIGDDNHWDINKRRDFQNDALIALTARRHGAIVVTANSSDFELLGAALRIEVLPAK